MSIPNHIPAHAIKVQFVYGPLKGYYHMWPASPGKLDSRWVWSALGNCGEEVNQATAQNSAYRWITTSSQIKQGDYNE